VASQIQIADKYYFHGFWHTPAAMLSKIGHLISTVGSTLAGTILGRFCPHGLHKVA